MRNGRVSGREERMAGKGRGGIPMVGSHPHDRDPKKTDCRTDLIGGGGNTDVCPGRQTHSRRHWIPYVCVCESELFGL